jgi:hypothetical protein
MLLRCRHFECWCACMCLLDVHCLKSAQRLSTPEYFIKWRYAVTQILSHSVAQSSGCDLPPGRPLNCVTACKRIAASLATAGATEYSPSKRNVDKRSALLVPVIRPRRLLHCWVSGEFPVHLHIPREVTSDWGGPMATLRIPWSVRSSGGYVCLRRAHGYTSHSMKRSAGSCSYRIHCTLWGYSSN